MKQNSVSKQDMKDYHAHGEMGPTGGFFSNSDDALKYDLVDNASDRNRYKPTAFSQTLSNYLKGLSREDLLNLIDESGYYDKYRDSDEFDSEYFEHENLKDIIKHVTNNLSPEEMAILSEDLGTFKPDVIDTGADVPDIEESIVEDKPLPTQGSLFDDDEEILQAMRESSKANGIDLSDEKLKIIKHVATMDGEPDYDNMLEMIDKMLKRNSQVGGSGVSVEVDDDSSDDDFGSNIGEAIKMIASHRV